MVALEAIHNWIDEPGELITWDPSPVTLAKVKDAPVSPVPASYQQAQHLRAYCEYRDRGIPMARLNVPSWNIPGKCDKRAMTHVINRYLRRHDTYHSWFQCGDTGQFVRRTIDNPRDITFVPTSRGEMRSSQWRRHVLATPDPLQWNCFSFGVIQRADHFTFYVSIDHLHADAMFMAAAFVEIHTMYTVLVGGAAPLQLPDAGSYHDYCVRQHEYTSALTVDSPEVRTWIEFAERNDGSLPRFPLPLGDPLLPCTGGLLTVQLLDEQQTRRFDSACIAAGARFSGGVFACAAFAEYQLVGAQTYYAITPTTTRKSAEEMMTTGWFTGLVPITVPVSERSFFDVARAAQDSFDSGLDLAHVPFERVLELAVSEPNVRKPQPGVAMLSFLDAGLPPLSPAIIAEWRGLNGSIYSDVGAAHQVGMWVNRLGEETTVTVGFPNNPVARESVHRYVAAMKSVYVGIAEGRNIAALSADTGAGNRERWAALHVAAG